MKRVENKNGMRKEEVKRNKRTRNKAKEQITVKQRMEIKRVRREGKRKMEGVM